MTDKRKCTARTRSGPPCRAWAMHGSDPPRCAAHRGDVTRSATRRGDTPHSATCRGDMAGPEAPSAPVGPDFYPEDPTAVTIDGAIAGLTDKMRRLDALIASHDQSTGAQWPPDEALIQLFGLYTQASTRLSHLLRDRRALSGEAADGLAGAIAQALDEIGTEWQVDL